MAEGTMKLKLTDIQRDNRLTPRAGIDKATVGSYAASFEQLPPIDVFWVEGRDGWWLVDGWHRADAAKQLELEDIEANEHQGTFEDALEFAYDANLKHGRPLTTGERKEAAKLKLIRHTERSNIWIAQDVGLSHTTVASLREELEGTSQIGRLSMLIGRDGKERPREMPKPKEERIEPVKLYKGKMEDILPGLGRFDLVVTDPPYGVTDRDWDELDTKGWLEAIVPHLADKYHLFWFCSPKQAADIEMVFRELGLEIQSRIVWHRRNMSMGSKAMDRFIDSWEMIYHVGNKPLNFPEGWTDAWFDVQIHAAPQSNFEDKKLHPTQKPYSLIRRLVEFGSGPGDKILDPFAGAGTTGAACQTDDRDCVLIEAEEKYVVLSEERLGIKCQNWKR